MFKEINDIKCFFDSPSREFHLRELARLMKRNPVTIKKHMKDFVKSGVIQCKKERNLEIYRSNSENFLYKEYKKIYNRLNIIDSGIIEFLEKELTMPTVVVFGSFAHGEDNENSDIDIFIISEIKTPISLDTFEKRLGKSIQTHIFSRKEWKLLKKTNPDLVNSIINGSIFCGFLEVL
jgi:predicted nucleotidyltransferase